MPKRPKRPRTSLDAHEAIKPHKITHARILFTSLQTDGPATCKELEQRTGIIHQTAGGRLGDLRDSGCVRHTGETRQTSNLSKGEVHEVVPGVSFDQHIAHQKIVAAAKATSAMGRLKKAAKQYAHAHHRNEPKEVWQPLIRALLGAAQTAFPLDEDEGDD